MQPTEAEIKKRRQNRGQKDQPDHRGGDAQDCHQPVRALAPPRQPRGDGGIAGRAVEYGRAHALALRCSSNREIANTMNEMTNRMKPNAKSEDSFRLPARLYGNYKVTTEA